MPAGLQSTAYASDALGRATKVGSYLAKGVRDEWHLLKPLWMAKSSYLFACDGTWLRKQKGSETLSDSRQR
ncbi:hypothetical protein ACVWWQ_002606 [Rhodanobacter sp. TND4EL1]